MRTAARILATAMYDAGFEVQDGPRRGAQRRGTVTFSYVRAARVPIVERGVIARPDLVVVAEPSLLEDPAAAVMHGVTGETILFINSIERAQEFRLRLGCPGRVVTWAEANDAAATIVESACAACVGAAARLVDGIARDSLECALVAQATTPRDMPTDIDRSLGLAAYDALRQHAGIVSKQCCRSCFANDMTAAPAAV